MAESSEEKGLFDQCVFAFVNSEDLTEAITDEYHKVVTRHDGEVVSKKRCGALPLQAITHIISETIEFPEYEEACETMIPVVRRRWIDASLQKGKLAQIRPHTPDPRMIFSNVVLTCADIPPTDQEAIIGATTAMGGMDSEQVTKLTTHICALSMDHPKVKQALDSRKKCKIVLPHWFDDCFKLGKRIDEKPYLLPDPEILRTDPSDPIDPPPCSADLEDTMHARPDYLAPPSAEAEGTEKLCTVFNKKKIMFSRDLEWRSRLKNICEGLILRGGGQLTEDPDECDWLVCRYRDTPEYVAASQQGKIVGNMSWLYYLIHQNKWSNPLHRLLHYPEPREGIPGFKDLRISVSNYGGEARIYLENLIKSAGATFTKTMKPENTHLVTARDNSEKCDAARDWNVHMVNHLWVEESYAKCEMQTLTVSKYTHFPPRTNLGEIIGKTFFDEKKLRAKYFPGSPKKSAPAPTSTTTASAKKKRKALEIADENISAEEHVPSATKKTKKLNVLKDYEMDCEDSMIDDLDMPAPPLPPQSKRRASELATPARGRHVRSGKENETPSTVASSSGRSAKDKALRHLSNLAPDVLLYEKEKKRGLGKDGQSPWGGKRAADLIEREHLNRRKVSNNSTVLDNEEGGEPRSEKKNVKKARPALPEVEIRVILTGFRRWVDDKNREDADRKKLRDMGIAVAQDGQPCDYLIAPQLVRTVKFLRNLSKGAMVLSSTWIEQCLETKEIPDPDEYILKDKENESRFGLKLETSIRRAQENKGRLLWGIPIYCTSSIKNGIDSYQAIAEANGAIFMVYGARSGSTIKPTKPEEDELGPEPVYLLSTSSPEEKKLWKRFEDMAKRGNMEPRVVASDWLLDVVMKQKVTFDEKYLVSNFF
ncbi:BRCT domain-containing protein [Xylariaceae sp. FL0255]|nr:BRCT domain-containing protein [Xylariaceae sp. FL0255]